jgi:hypothetical protein
MLYHHLGYLITSSVKLSISLNFFYKLFLRSACCIFFYLIMNHVLFEQKEKRKKYLLRLYCEYFLYFPWITCVMENYYMKSNFSKIYLRILKVKIHLWCKIHISKRESEPWLAKMGRYIHEVIILIHESHIKFNVRNI